MSGRADLLFAFAAATAVHAGVLVAGLPPDNGGGAGNGGTDRLSFDAASPAIAALVQKWDQPPATSLIAPMSAPEPPRDVAPTTPIGEKPARVALPTGLEIAALPSPIPKLATLVPNRPENPLTPRQKPTLAGVEQSILRPTVSRFQSTDAPRPPTLDTNPPIPDRAPHLAQRPVSRPSSEPSPAVTRRVAIGIGESGTRGKATASPAPKTSQASRRAAASAWAAAIQRRIARHHAYPRGTKAEGRVRVAMVVLPSGRLERVSVMRSSGTAALDRAAIAAVKRAAPFPPAPDVLSDKWFDIGQWITFERR